MRFALKNSRRRGRKKCGVIIIERESGKGPRDVYCFAGSGLWENAAKRVEETGRALGNGGAAGV